MKTPTKAYMQGQEAARQLKPLDCLETAGFDAFDPASRFQWIRGWESEGGDISRRVVVTRLQRLTEREQQLATDLQWVREEIAKLKQQ